MTARVFDDRPCELGEGPLWHPGRRQLFWFDILGQRLLSRDDTGPREWQMGERASAAGWIDDDRLLIATETGLYRFDLASGARDLLAPLEADRAETRSNDGRTDPWGGFWIGTMGVRAQPGAGAIHRFHDGRVTRLFDGLTVPNAICFAADRSRAFFADTPTGRVMSVALDAQGWPDGPPAPFLDLTAEGLHPDGAVIDAEGGFWCAQWGAGRVARYTADGRFDRALELPAPHTTCPAFGGAGLNRLFVTTAREGRDNPGDAEGLTYELDPGTTGRAEPQVIA